MEKIKITFLGTGDAIPTEKRNHTGIFLSFANENILIDCGEGIQRQMKFAKISPVKITRILITHWHGDHTLGLLGLMQSLALQNYRKTLKIYGPPGTKKYFNILENFMAFYKRMNSYKIEIHEVQNEAFINEKEFFVETKSMEHGIPVNSYAIVLKDKVRLDKNKVKKLKLPNSPLLGQLVAGKDILFQGRKIKPSQAAYTEKGKKLSVILDTKTNENAIKIAKNSDLLIAESSFLSKDKKLAYEYKHLTASQAAEIAKKAKAKKLILTHISQRYEHSLHLAEKEARKIFKNTHIVKDLDVVEI